MKIFCDGNKSPGSWRKLSGLAWVVGGAPSPRAADNMVTCWVEPAHLHITKLAALCAQGTLNFYLIHARSAWAMASFSLVLQLPFSCSGFHITSTQTMEMNALYSVLCVRPFGFLCFSHYQQNKFLPTWVWLTGLSYSIRIPCLTHSTTTCGPHSFRTYHIVPVTQSVFASLPLPRMSYTLQSLCVSLLPILWDSAHLLAYRTHCLSKQQGMCWWKKHSTMEKGVLTGQSWLQNICHFRTVLLI